MTSDLTLSPDDIVLTVLATSDVHANLLSYDYYADQPSERPALSRLASLIARERALSANTLLLDNGDFLQGTPLSDLFVDLTPPETLENPVITAMNHLGYDAAALGNHEFNLSLADLKATLARARFPKLCANLIATDPSAELTKDIWLPDTVLERSVTDGSGRSHTLRIGLFGVMPPQVLSWDRSRIGEKIRAEDILVGARRSVDRLRAQGVDLIIALAHTGLSAGPHVAGMEHAAAAVAALDGVDVVVAGHSHLAFPGSGQPDDAAFDHENARIHGTSTLMPGPGGRSLAKFTLVLSPCDAGFRLGAAKAELASGAPALVAEDPDFVRLLQPAHDWLISEIRKPVGHTDRPLHSYFGLLPGNLCLQVIADAQARYVHQKLRGTPYADLPLLSASAPQKCGGRGGPTHYTDVPAGPIALSHITDIQYFPNEICALRMTGAELADWLEMAASIYRQALPGRGDQPLVDISFPPYNSDTIFGLTYQIDLSQPARYGTDGGLRSPATRRVQNICHKGAPIDPAQDFVVAVNNYRAGGGGYVPHVAPDRIIFEDTTKVRDLIITHLQAIDGQVGAARTPWQFTPVPGAAATFATTPAAVSHLSDSRRLSQIGATPDGFLLCRYDLT
ncbi:bifunctional 2',3'-cyclic-nucleotide 2'-phosphodiesterase/3'-nucleotidase [Shimia sp. SDUM112013]|uniref:bifunctional 2',3'-cyclic-nucleotide 2'-phosphodiesterase/3'-nucleotidase n=1 Tax=Shimia sp. SDUM112013 TaxID=3136160 RepID=UPI0032EE0FF5